MPDGVPDFGSEAFQTNPWPTYRAGLTGPGVVSSVGDTAFCVYQPDAAHRVLVGREFTSAHPFRRTRQAFGPSALDTDGVQHGRYRAGLADLVGRSTASLDLTATARVALDAVRPEHNPHWVGELGRRLPYDVLATVMDWPAVADPDVRAMVRPLTAYIDMGPTPMTDVLHARRQVTRFASEGLRACPILTSAQHRSARFAALSPVERTANLLMILIAGTETMTASLTNLIWRAGRRPEEYRRAYSLVEARRQFVADSLDEQPPVHFTVRFAARDVSLSGVDIPRGAMVQVCLATASGQLTFGAGPHRCLGARLAVAQLEAALAVLLERYAAVNLTDGQGDLPPAGRTIRGSWDLRADVVPRTGSLERL